LGPRPVVGKAALHQDLISATFCRQLDSTKPLAGRKAAAGGYARAGCAAISRPSADSAIATMWRAFSPA
jgi:hypothetical protein